MVVTKIKIEPYLAEYLIGKYNACDSASPVRFPDSCDLYHLIYDLMSKRPANKPTDEGLLAIALPHRDRGKQPDTYNYLSDKARAVFQRRVKISFNADLHAFVDEQHHVHGVPYKEAVLLFLSKHGIDSITDDAVWKNYYRWREKIRRNKKKSHRL